MAVWPPEVATTVGDISLRHHRGGLVSLITLSNMNPTSLVLLQYNRGKSTVKKLACKSNGSLSVQLPMPYMRRRTSTESESAKRDGHSGSSGVVDYTCACSSPEILRGIKRCDEEEDEKKKNDNCSSVAIGNTIHCVSHTVQVILFADCRQ